MRRRQYSTHALCRFLRVSESGYYRSLLDCYNGEIVGLSMDDNMGKGRCIRAFEDSCRARDVRGMVLHSDRGSQFTSADFRKSLARYEAVHSMSDAGRCYDNARMESFFATLKKEKLYKIRTEQVPMAQGKTIVFRYIMT